MRCMCVLALVLVPGAALPLSVSAQTTEQLQARCSQLIAYYDRYGVGRSLNSDGRRNHARIAAEIDCQGGKVELGIARMTKLLQDKAFSLPSPGPNVLEDED